MSEPNASSTHGFYRYTDILYEYPKTIGDPKEAFFFKAFLRYTALGDPGHPLWTNKERGIELHLGTLPSGQTRLLFSSTQVEYTLYWLHAMGFTKTRLSLPSSRDLLTEPALRNVSACYYNSPTMLKKAVNEISKNNRKLKGANSTLISNRHSFDKVREMYASKKGTWMAIDIEAWEVAPGTITEFGWSQLQWNGSEEVVRHGHIIIKENKGLRNGKYVADAQADYAFGTSTELKKADFKKEIREMIVGFQNQGPLFLVFHDCRQDIKYLKNSNYFSEELTHGVLFSFPCKSPDKGTFVIDTTELFGALEGDTEKRNLGDICRLLKIETQNLHNAGNDAYYTMLALKSMASGNQVDAQREERWPNQTLTTAEMGASLKVMHNPSDEDSDYSGPDSEVESSFDRPIKKAKLGDQLLPTATGGTQSRLL